MVVVDTNVLVLAANRDATHHEACRRWIEERRVSPDAWFLTWSIVYEFLRVVTHPRVFPNPWTVEAAWSFLAALARSPGLEFLVETQRHEEVLASLLDEMPQLAGNVLHDAHTAALMREHGVRRIATRDTDFHQFRFLEVMDPVA
jgi:hypothetical protein